jgi:hypothetical protein
LDHLVEDSSLLQQFSRRAEFDEGSHVEHHDLVVVRESREFVGNREYGLPPELARDYLLDEGVVPDVDVGRGLVDEDEIPALPSSPFSLSNSQ